MKFIRNSKKLALLDLLSPLNRMTIIYFNYELFVNLDINKI
jgi:hypothetical protein